VRPMSCCAGRATTCSWAPERRTRFGERCPRRCHVAVGDCGHQRASSSHFGREAAVYPPCHGRPAPAMTRGQIAIGVSTPPPRFEAPSVGGRPVHHHVAGDSIARTIMPPEAVLAIEPSVHCYSNARFVRSLRYLLARLGKAPWGMRDWCGATPGFPLFVGWLPPGDARNARRRFVRGRWSGREGRAAQRSSYRFTINSRVPYIWRAALSVRTG
jgi:hypothetical protein